MGKVIILGTSNVIPDETRDNTHLLVKTEDRVILIDVTGNTLSRLRKIGIQADDLTDVILTHFHPDHVSGFPLLMMGLWLSGRRKALSIYGLRHTISRVKKMVDLFDLNQLPNFFRMDFHQVRNKEGTSILSDDRLEVIGSPVNHFIPTMGLRMDFLLEKKSLVYSSDTEPCCQIVRLAHKTDVLIHEATGALPGHSSAGQAGSIASQAAVGQLYLIHYPNGVNIGEKLVKEARDQFAGKVQLAVDMMTVDF